MAVQVMLLLKVTVSVDSKTHLQIISNIVYRLGDVLIILGNFQQSVCKWLVEFRAHLLI